MSSCRESSFRRTGAETRIRAKADNCWRNASWSKTRPASCGTSIVTVNAAIPFAFLYNSRSSTILYRLGPFGIPRLLSSPGRDAPVACEVLPVSGDATSRRVHELGRWLTPVPSTEVKDQSAQSGGWGIVHSLPRKHHYSTTVGVWWTRGRRGWKRTTTQGLIVQSTRSAFLQGCEQRVQGLYAGWAELSMFWSGEGAHLIRGGAADRSVNH